jgi:molybdate transport system ATP-binding protein
VSLGARVALQLGSLGLDVDVRADDGETVAVLGPNGAGKTTLLRALAGLVPIDRGRIEVDGELLDDGGRVFVPPERRPVGVVFQDYLLFPHLTVLENVAFGLRSRGAGRGAARAAARAALERVELSALAGQRPRALSGGQAQRVALARAIATEPRLLLLDEPLAALDQSARGAVRRELRSHLATFRGVRLLVTHDPLDAAALADRLVILEHGSVVQCGTFADVSARPRSRYVAELVGVNLLHGTAHGDAIELECGATLIVPDAGIGAALAVFHPRSVALHRDRPTGSPRNVSEGHVQSIELLGDRVRVRVAGAVSLVAEVTPAAVNDLGLVEGAPVWTAVKATEITVFPA